MKKSISKLFVVVILAAFAACDSNKNSGDKSGKDSIPDTTSNKKEKPEMVINQDLDNVVKFISGIKQGEGSSLAYLDTLPEWKEFSASFDSSWKKIERERFAKMIDWRKTELSNANTKPTNLFYPFSGPDILNALIFFPEADTVTMIALEPSGKLPDLKNMDKKRIKHYLASVDQSLHDLFQKSYFITKNMINDLHRESVNGTVPLMCIFLKRTGNSIADIKEIAVNEEGKIVPRNDSVQKNLAKGVQIDFVSPEGKKKTLFYYKTDLSDDGLKVNKGFYTYLNNMPVSHSYLKSASYLMHYGTFNMIRNVVLDKSDMVLQDDSGIAYRFFKKDKWNVQLYGKYVDPVKDFKHDNVGQPDLKKAYSEEKVKDMPFTLGYHWGTKEVNLQMATKK